MMKKRYGVHKPHFKRGLVGWGVYQTGHCNGCGTCVKDAWRVFKRCNLTRWGKVTTFACEAYNKREGTAEKKPLS